MTGTVLFVLFAVVYAICWPLNRFLIARKKVNPGYIYLAVLGLLLLNQIRLALVQDLDAYVFGTIVGTWLIPTILGLFIARKFARDNPGSIPWGVEVTASTSGDKAPFSDAPSWMKD